MAKRYVMTPKRKAALKRAQAISAKKRKGKGKTSKRSGMSRKRKAAVTAGAALALAGAAYAVRKKSKKNYFGKNTGSTVVHSSSPELNRAMRTARRTGAPSSRSLKAVGYQFGYQANLAMAKAKQKPARRGAPKSGSTRAQSTRTAFEFSRQIPRDRAYRARHRMADKANRQRGLAGYTPSKAKHDRRRTAAQRKKWPRY